MNDLDKRKQLRRYKAFATGLFLLMVIIFILTTFAQKSDSSHWIGYLRAFSEAAMVGALADWFAVTALFHYPLGLKIPHTNLIQNSKQKIGDNLGNFVVENFLSPQNIRPYIVKLKLSHFLGEWLEKPKHQGLILKESSTLILDILQKLDNEAVVQFISKKAKEMTSNIKLPEIIANGLHYVLDKNAHQQVITQLSGQIKTYILFHKEMVRERVKKESYLLIPKFVDDAVADKITQGLVRFFEDVEQDPENQIRAEITQKLRIFTEDLKTGRKWDEEFSEIKNQFLTDERIQRYAQDIWQSIKKTMIEELSAEESAFKTYVQKNLVDLSKNLQEDLTLQHKIDHWIRVTAYKYILKNTNRFGDLISTTVGNWEGVELSRKLELEVGKDLQFIRVNGTLVGGLVGLFIYTITHFFI